MQDLLGELPKLGNNKRKKETMATLEEVLEYDLENYYGEGYRSGALTAYYNNSPSYCATLGADEILESFEEAYLGEYDSILDYAYELVSDTGQLDGIPSFVAQYFDYASFARDMELGGDVWYDRPYLFRS